MRIAYAGGMQRGNHEFSLPQTEGFSVESGTIVEQHFQAFYHYFFQSIRETSEEKFRRLAKAWLEDTAHVSSATERAMHPAYQEIIGMGPEVIPMILRELDLRPNHWFWALRALTGIDPVMPSQRGQIRQMAEAWLRWASEEGYRR